jgi:hypothetical protein
VRRGGEAVGGEEGIESLCFLIVSIM